MLHVISSHLERIPLVLFRFCIVQYLNNCRTSRAEWYPYQTRKEKMTSVFRRKESQRRSSDECLQTQGITAMIIWWLSSAARNHSDDYMTSVFRRKRCIDRLRFFRLADFITELFFPLMVNLAFPNEMWSSNCVLATCKKKTKKHGNISFRKKIAIARLQW